MKPIKDMTEFGPTAHPPGDQVNHPDHYGGDTTYEVIKVLEAWGLNENARLWNAVKYIARAGRKGDYVEDLRKAAFYLEREIHQATTSQVSAAIVQSFVPGAGQEKRGNVREAEERDVVNRGLAPST